MSEPAPSPFGTPRVWVLVAALVAIAIAAYMPAISGGWIYDDIPLIPNNPHAHSLADWQWWFTHDFWHVDEELVRAGGTITYWRPLISASYAFDWTVGGGSPLMFHITNLIANAVVAVLAFAVLRRWLGSVVPAAIVAALFIVHPTKAESVAWIAGRTDVFCMIAMLVATTGIGRRLRGEKHGLVLEIIGTIGAYLCKEQAIVLPAFVLVELWLAIDRPAIDLAFVKRSVRPVAPQTAIAIGYLLIRAIVLPVRSGGTTPPPLDHLLAILDSLGRYVALTIAPVKLTIQQGLVYTIGAPTHSVPYVILGATSLLGVGSLALYWRRRWPAATLGIIFFGVTIAPTANIIYTQMSTIISERFLYLPMFGVAFVVGSAIMRATHQRFVAIVVLVVTLVLAGLSARRSADYSDENRFWTRELATNPDSREARTFLIAAIANEKRYLTALEQLQLMQQRIRQSSLGIEYALQIAEVTAQLIPDLSTDELKQLDAFATHLLERDQPSATLNVRGVNMTINVTARQIVDGIDRQGIRLWELRAMTATRLGNFTDARAQIAKARAMCPLCTTVIITEALVLARCGDIDGGLAALERGHGAVAEEPLEKTKKTLLAAREHRDASLQASGPAAIQERASELSTLELWGQAYLVLAPYKEQIKAAPGVAGGFAELAFRAGKPDVAREMLATLIPPAEVAAQLEQWNDAMGWRR